MHGLQHHWPETEVRSASIKCVSGTHYMNLRNINNSTQSRQFICFWLAFHVVHEGSWILAITLRYMHMCRYYELVPIPIGHTPNAGSCMIEWHDQTSNYKDDVIFSLHSNINNILPDSQSRYDREQLEIWAMLMSARLKANEVVAEWSFMLYKLGHRLYKKLVVMKHTSSVISCYICLILTIRIKIVGKINETDKEIGIFQNIAIALSKEKILRIILAWIWFPSLGNAQIVWTD